MGRGSKWTQFTRHYGQWPDARLTGAIARVCSLGFSCPTTSTYQWTSGSAVGGCYGQVPLWQWPLVARRHALARCRPLEALLGDGRSRGKKRAHSAAWVPVELGGPGAPPADIQDAHGRVMNPPTVNRFVTSRLKPVNNERRRNGSHEAQAWRWHRPIQVACEESDAEEHCFDCFVSCTGVLR